MQMFLTLNFSSFQWFLALLLVEFAAWWKKVSEEPCLSEVYAEIVSPDPSSVAVKVAKAKRISGTFNEAVDLAIQKLKPQILFD